MSQEYPLRPAETAGDVTIPGLSIHYAVWGAEHPPERTALMIHGITSNCQAWTIIGPALAAQGYRVIAPDLRGRGLSAKPPHGYGIPYHVDDLLGVCDALGLKQVAFIGHSLGAQIGLMFAAVHPQRVDRLVLMDAGAAIPADWRATIAPSLKRLGVSYPSLEAYLAMLRQSPAYQWNAFWDTYFTYDAEQQPDGSVISRVPVHAIEEEAAVNSLQRLDGCYEAIHAPTLIVRAGYGTLGPDTGFILEPAEAGRMRQRIADARLVEIPAVNHYTMLTSGAMSEAILAFLAETPQSAG